MKLNFNKTLLYVIPALIGLSANAQKDAAAKTPGINVPFMDKSVKPSDDFFKFVNFIFYLFYF